MFKKFREIDKHILKFNFLNAIFNFSVKSHVLRKIQFENLFFMLTFLAVYLIWTETMADKKKSSSKNTKIELATDPNSLDFQSLDELQRYFDQKQSDLMKRLSEMVVKLADVENELNQKEEEKSKMELLNADLVKEIAKKDQHIDTLRKVIRMLY